MSQPHVPSEADIPAEAIHRLTVAQYDEMARTGILTSSDRVELLEGWLVEKMTKNPPHRIATRHVRLSLEAVTPPGWYVDTQEPIVTADSEPEPDVVVIRGKTEDYSDRNPGAEHVALVIEIADSTLIRDRQLKARIYGRAGIPIYWIVNLTERTLEVHMDPSGAKSPAGYSRRAVHRPGETVAVVIDGKEVAAVEVSALLA